MSRLIGMMFVVALVVCLTGCSANTTTDQSSGSVSEVSLEDISVNTADFKRESWQYPNMPAIIEQLRSGGWLDAQSESLDYERIFVDLSMFDVENDDTGNLYDLGEVYKDFTNAKLQIGMVDGSDAVDSGYISLMFDSGESYRFTIDEDGDVYSMTTNRETGYLIDPSVEEYLTQEFQMEGETLPSLIGFGEPDALDLLDQLGMPENSLRDIKQVYYRTPSTDIIPMLTGEPQLDDDRMKKWVAEGGYVYELRATYIGNGYPVAVSIIASEAYAITRDQIKQSVHAPASDGLIIDMPQSKVTVSFDLSGRQKTELDSGSAQWKDVSDTSFMDNDTYPYEFTDVVELGGIF